jgi:2-isopropylmalate synthase
VASVKAYVNALNRLIVRRTKSAPDSDVKSVNYRDAS